MYRLAFAALLMATASASAGDQSHYAHTHIGKRVIDGASFTSPINYERGSSVVRTPNYSETPTISYVVRQGYVFTKAPSPLLEAARQGNGNRSIISVETFN